jgi:hypothetical protein
MKEVAPPVAIAIAKDRQPGSASPEDGDHYLKVWRERESLHGKQVDAFVLILKTAGCYWARVKGCTMCGYSRDTLGREATRENIQHQMEGAMERYKGEPYVKVFTSGSFLDPSEVPVDARELVTKAFRGRASRFLFESLPEFVSEESITGMRDSFGGELEVAVGLETTQEEVLRRSVSKVSTVKDYLEAAVRVEKAGALPKAYLLLKPPFLTEREAIEDAVTSIEIAAKYFPTISLNPVNVQGRTVVEHLWRRQQYRPPWLWSLVEALVRGKERIDPSVRLVSFPTSGGNVRGVHNCLACDSRILKAVEWASLTQDFANLKDAVDCSCKERWIWENTLEAMSP